MQPVPHVRRERTIRRRDFLEPHGTAEMIERPQAVAEQVGSEMARISSQSPAFSAFCQGRSAAKLDVFATSYCARLSNGAGDAIGNQGKVRRSLGTVSGGGACG